MVYIIYQGYFTKISEVKYIPIYGIYFLFAYQNIYHMLVYILLVIQFILGAAGDFSRIYVSIIWKSSSKTLRKFTIHSAFSKFSRACGATHNNQQQLNDYLEENPRPPSLQKNWFLSSQCLFLSLLLVVAEQKHSFTTLTQYFSNV